MGIVIQRSTFSHADRSANPTAKKIHSDDPNAREAPDYQAGDSHHGFHDDYRLSVAVQKEIVFFKRTITHNLSFISIVYPIFVCKSRTFS